MGKATGHLSDGRNPSESATSTKLSAAAQLLADIQAANGLLRIAPDQRERYGKIVGALKRTKGLLPERKTVHLTVRDGSWCLVLDDPPPPLLPIRVKARLSNKSHPAVATVRDGRTRVLSRPVLARALRCVDALATESERRGYAISGTTSGVVVAVRGHRTVIEFKEPQDRSPHEPTPAEISEDARWSWRTYPAYDYKPSGRLRIEVGHSRYEDPKPKADGRLTGRPVEDRLAEVLARAETRALEAEAADRYREEQAARRQRQWEGVRAQAIIEYSEQYRAQALLDQAARFADTRRLDEYLAALDDHIAGMFDPDERAAADEWREWASEYRKRRDPFAGAPRMPKVPDPNHDDLAPFMRGLSVWGPA